MTTDPRVQELWLARDFLRDNPTGFTAVTRTKIHGSSASCATRTSTSRRAPRRGKGPPVAGWFTSKATRPIWAAPR